MAISDKYRKILWARSGNRCAICKNKLVVDETLEDDDSVVGAECHIAARSPGGARFNSNLPSEQSDNIENLILLCATHHKMIDDQSETYTVELLKQIKANHESWVDNKLKDIEEVKPIRFIRFKEKIPRELPLIKSGRELLTIAEGCHGAYHQYSDHLNDSETDLVGCFLQYVQDYLDLCSCLEPAEKVREAKAIDDQLNELAEIGLFVFAATEIQRLEGGIGQPQNFHVLHLSIQRATDPNISWK